MKSKETCFALLNSESEREVQQIVESTSEFRKASNWCPLDNRETNFNVTSNQASDGGKALTELMTNMVDAVLMKHAYIKKIDPKSSKAPKTMYEAVDKLIKPLQGGKLVNLDPNEPRTVVVQAGGYREHRFTHGAHVPSHAFGVDGQAFRHVRHRLARRARRLHQRRERRPLGLPAADRPLVFLHQAHEIRGHESGCAHGRGECAGAPGGIALVRHR